MSLIETTDIERRIAGKIDPNITGSMELASNRTSGLAFADMAQVMEFAKAMSIAQIAIPKHLRGNPGACLAVALQAVEWEMSPFAVANKSYSVSDRLSYEAQLISAVILRRAPIKGRFKVEYKGEGDNRTCRVWVNLRDENESVEYLSPPFGKILPKNSPLWKNDPDQQLFYYSSRALCRRHFPDVLLGVYAVDELDEAPPHGPHAARDITPRRNLEGRLDALAGVAHDPETGEIVPDKQLHEDPADSAAATDGSVSPQGAPSVHSSSPATQEQAGDGKPAAAGRVAASKSAGAAGNESAPAQLPDLKAASEAGLAECRKYLAAHPDAEKTLGRTAVELAMSAAEAIDGKRSADSKRAAILADLSRTGDAKAKEGKQALDEFIDDLSGDETAMLTHAQVKAWREIAGKVGANV